VSNKSDERVRECSSSVTYWTIYG